MTKAPAHSGPAAAPAEALPRDTLGLGTATSVIVASIGVGVFDTGPTQPVLSAVRRSAIPLVLLILSTELSFLQRGLDTQELTARQWSACAGLALVLPIVVEIGKWFRRRRLPPPAPGPVAAVVSPARVVVTTT